MLPTRPSWLGVDVARVLHLAAVFCLTCVLLKGIQLLHRRRELLRAFAKFPGPPTHWLFGHVHEVGEELDLPPRGGEGDKYLYAHPNWFGSFMAILTVSDPDYAKTLATSSGACVSPGNGLLVLHGPKWHQHRKLLTPGFHFDVLKPYVALMAESTNVMLDKWEQMITDGKPVELFEHVSLMTLDSIMKCAFSCHSNCQTNRQNSYIQAVYRLCYLVHQRLSIFPYHNDIIYWLSPHGYWFRKACKLAHQHTGIPFSLSFQIKAFLQEQAWSKHCICLIRHCSSLHPKDTPSRPENGISWLFYCLASHPEHQTRCREEIQGILGDRDTLRWEDLGKMTYTTMCIKESLRLYPPVPGVARQLSKPVTFHDGRSLPEGLQIPVSLYVSVFDPLRFSPENVSGRHSHAFLPFAAGLR
uniref:Cytochrome P450 4B1 n=1 Tax=Nothoprocta perdicaria TaxID=30464 RepID=A0A8C6ZST3_NOTPE